MNQSPTHVVPLTPPGRGAVAVVLVDGPLAVAAVGAAFSAANGKPLSDQRIERILFGKWNDRASAPGEELIVCRRGPERVEVQPHGGRASVRAVIDTLVAAGCVALDWTEGIALDEPNPIRAAAHVALASAPTERTAMILLDQYHGALDAAMETIRAAHATAGDSTEAIHLIETLLARADVGLHLTRPFRVVLTGPPNVGKSSLVNALLGYDRAIVFDQPGTTRDVVTAEAAVDGWPVEFSDTAGLRDGGDAIESEGVRRAIEQCATADLIVEVREAGAAEDQRATDASTARKRLCVKNKIDLLGATARAARFENRRDDAFFTSATTGEGIPELLDAIAARLVPNPPPPGAAVPFTTEQVATLRAMQ